MSKATEISQGATPESDAPTTVCCATCECPATNGLYCDACQPLVAFALRGTQLLDEREAGWASRPRLNLRKLDMELHGRCLLSLLFGSYRSGIERLDLGPLLILGPENWDNYGWEHGFTIPPTTPEEETKAAFARLTAIWKVIILERREALTTANEKPPRVTRSEEKGT